MSDWSSDVCSSDLVLGFLLPGVLAALVAWRLRASLDDGAPWAARIGAWLALLSALAFAAQGLLPLDPRDLESDASRMHATMWTLWWVARSEEHTSELQSLMRISYAVFCLKKKKRKQHPEKTA